MNKELVEYGKSKSRKLKGKKKELDALRAQKEEIKQNLEQMRIEEEAETEAMWLDALNRGVVKIKHLINGIDEQKILDAYANHRNVKVLAKEYGHAAILTLVNSLSSIDERNRIAAAKIITDIASPTKREEEEGEEKDKQKLISLEDKAILTTYLNQLEKRGASEL